VRRHDNSVTDIVEVKRRNKSRRTGQATATEPKKGGRTFLTDKDDVKSTLLLLFHQA